MKIEAILFDLGKVIVDFDFELGLQKLHAASPLSRDEFEEILWDENCARRYERGELSTSDFHAYLCDAANLKMDLQPFLDTWSSVFLPDLIVSEELLAALKRKYPLILVSNTNAAHIDFVRANYRVLDYFDHLVLSYEVGSLKPDRGIFDRAIQVAGRPAEALFFTDDREENIVAARQLGIHAYQFNSESQLLDALQRAGVEIADFVGS